MLKGRWALVVNHLTLISLGYEDGLVLKSVSTETKMWSLDEVKRGIIVLTILDRITTWSLVDSWISRAINRASLQVPATAIRMVGMFHRKVSQSTFK